VRRRVDARIAASGKGGQLWRAVSSDALIATSLNRSNYGARNVVAVGRSGSQLVVYVY
jgi:hypothetical protein